MVRQVWLGMVRLGMVWQVWQGWAWCGEVRQVRHGGVGHGVAGLAGLGMVR